MTINSKNKYNNFRVVVLAGGHGTRLKPYTMVLPKPLMPIGDMPILEIIINQLRSAGIKDLTFSVGYLASLIEAYFGDGSQWGMNIRYSREKEPLGTAGPIAIITELSDTFLVMNGDLLTTLDYGEMIRYHNAQNAVVTVGLYRKNVKIDLGVVEKDSGNRITGYVEKPTLAYDVSMGVYVMEPRVLKYIPSGIKFDLPELVKSLILANEKVVGYNFNGYWLDIGRHEDYAQAIELFEQKKKDFLPDLFS